MTTQTFFRELLEASAVGAGLGLLLLAILMFSGGRIPPAWRHGLLFIAVARLLLILPPVSMFSWENIVPQPSVVIVPMETTAAVEDTERGDQPDEIESTSPAAVFPERPIEAESPISVETPSSLSLFEILGIVWMVGFLFMVSLVLFSVIKLRRTIRDASAPPADGTLRIVFDSLSEVPGFRKSLRLLLTDRIATPALAGLLRPTILFPTHQAAKLTPSEIRLILLHEAGHARRCDLWTNALLLFVQCVHWFNPFVWFLTRRIRIESERATDTWVLQRIGSDERTDYGNTLISLLAQSTGPLAANPVTIGVLERKRDLAKRVSEIAAFRERKTWIAAFACLILASVFAAIGLTQAPEDAEPESEFSINLQITGESGTPVSSPIIELYEFGEPWRRGDLILSSKGDGQGIFQTKLKLKGKQIIVQARTADHSMIGGTVWYDSKISPLMNADGNRVRILVSETKEISFQFVDEKGQGIDGLNLSMYAYRYDVDNIDRSSSYHIATTDREGRCILTLPRNQWLIIRHDRKDLTNIEGESGAVKTAEATASWTFPLKPAYTLRGKFTLPDGTALAGAYIHNDRVGSEGLAATSDENGDYEIHHLEPATHRFKTRMPTDSTEGWVLEPQEIAVSDQSPVTVHNITAKKGGTLNVTFIDSITDERLGTVAHPGIDTATTSISVFDFKLPDNYHLPRGNEVEFSFGENTEIPIEVRIKPIEPEDTVHGRVIDEAGKPVHLAKVIITPKIFHDPILTNEQGEFSHFFPDRLLRGRETATIYAEFGDRSTEKYEWPAGTSEEAVLTLREPETGKISGRILDEKGGPIPNAEILLWSTDFHKYRTTVKTDAEGKYLFDAVRPGCNLIVHAKHPDYGEDDYRGSPIEKKWKPLHLEPGETVAIRDIELPLANKSISGRVVDTKGKPVYNAVLFCFDSGNQQEFRVYTKKDGSFEIPKLIDKWIHFELRTQMSMNEGPWRSCIVRAGSKDVELVMPDRIKKRVYSADGLDFTGKKAPAIVAESWINTTAPPADKPDGKPRFLIVLALDRPTSYVTYSIKQVQKAQNEHPEIEFIIVHGNSPVELIEATIAEINEDIEITLPIAVEPFLGSLSEKLEWNTGGALLLDGKGIVIQMDKDYRKVLDFINSEEETD